jgi:hypothetical protein
MASMGVQKRSRAPGERTGKGEDEGGGGSGSAVAVRSMNSRAHDTSSFKLCSRRRDARVAAGTNKGLFSRAAAAADATEGNPFSSA